MSADELDTLRRRFRQLLRGARWTRSRTPAGAPLLVGRLAAGGHRVLVWPQPDGRLRIGCDLLRVGDLYLTPREALLGLTETLSADGRPRYARALDALHAAATR